MSITSNSISSPLPNTISWSKNGFIAFSTPGGSSNLSVTYLENVDGASWQLAPWQQLTIKPTADSIAVPELTLVSWSSLSSDLAVGDVYGNLYVMLTGVGVAPGDSGGAAPGYELTSYNHLEMIHRDILNHTPALAPNPSAQIVAFDWLYVDKPQLVSKPARASGGGGAAASGATANGANGAANGGSAGANGAATPSYSYDVFQHHPTGLAHPIPTKQAAVCVRANGQFTLYYQGEHKVEYHKLAVQLDSHRASPVRFTRADVGFTADGAVIVCAYDAISGTVRTYSVRVGWGFLADSSQKQKVDPHYNTPKDHQHPPTLAAELVHEMDPRGPLAAVPAPEAVCDPVPASIDIISPDANCRNTDVLLSYDTYAEASKYTTVFRYRVDAESAGHAWERAAAAANPDTTLTIVGRLTASSITSITPWLNLLVVTAGGRVWVVDRQMLGLDLDLNLGPNLGPVSSSTASSTTSSTEITSLFDVGYRVPAPAPSDTDLILVAVSPTMASVAYIDISNGTSTLEYLQPPENPSPESWPATAAALALHHAYACYSNTCSDDLAVLMGRAVESAAPNNDVPAAVASLLAQCHHAIHFHLDSFSKDSVDKLLSNPPLQKLLSLQLVLGELPLCRGTNMSDIAWVVLNLRTTCFSIMFLLSSIYRQILKKKPSEDSLQDSVVRGEKILLLTGPVRWLVDLVVYLNQELIHAGAPGAALGRALGPGLAVPLILSKVPRLFLMYALSSIAKTVEVLKKLHHDLNEANKLFTPMKESLNRFFTASSQSPVNVAVFETFLRECDAHMAGQGTKGGLAAEQSLVCRGEVPVDMEELSRWVVTKHGAYATRDLKVAEIYYYDVSWLDVGRASTRARVDGGGTGTGGGDVAPGPKKFVPRLAFPSGLVDGLRKNLIGDPTGLRRCTRCRTVSLENDPLVYGGGAVGLWSMVFQRTCVCGNAWVSI